MGSNSGWTSDSPRAGLAEKFHSGTKTYLAPKPLPTGFPAVDFSDLIVELTDEVAEIGASRPTVFGWQLIIGVPFFFMFITLLVMPYSVYLFIVAFNGNESYAGNIVETYYDKRAWIAYTVGLGAFFIGLTGVYKRVNQFSTLPRLRFNRQRREVCYITTDTGCLVYQPWESVVSWMIEARGVTEYGVQRQSAFGIGLQDPQSGEVHTLECQTVVSSFGISSWEAIRSFMEYKVNSLDEIKAEKGQEAGEGVAYFRRARANVHEQYRDGKISILSLLGWYFYHVFTLWTIPNRLLELEETLIARKGSRTIPEEVEEWSKPLPESERARPSEDLLAQSKRVTELRHEQPERPILDIFAQVSAECNQQEPTVKANSG